MPDVTPRMQLVELAPASRGFCLEQPASSTAQARVGSRRVVARKAHRRTAGPGRRRLEADVSVTFLHGSGPYGCVQAGDGIRHRNALGLGGSD